MTGDLAAALAGLQRRLDPGADLHRRRAPRVEPAPGRHAKGARHLAGDDRARGGSSGWDGSAAAKSACVYGCIGQEHRLSLSADSTILPRYITAIRWLMCATVARSWPMKR